MPDGTPWDVAPDAYDCGWLRPAGFAFSSVLDYASFLRFLYRGDPRVLSDPLRMAMQSRIVDTYMYGKVDAYGYGILVGSGYPFESGGATWFYDSPYLNHRGGIAGFSSMFYFFPETGFGFVSFGSTDGAYPDGSLANALASFSGLSTTQTLPPSVRPGAKTFPTYAGTFVDGSGLFGPILVSDDNGTFSVSLPALDALGITYDPTLTESAEYGFLTTITAVPPSAASATVGLLLFPGAPLGFDFIPSKGNRFDWLVIQLGLPAFPARRVAPDEAP
jgi:hypothetical protein